MKLDLLHRNQLQVMERLDNLETQSKSDTTDVDAIVAIPHRDITCFNEEEKNLRASSSSSYEKQDYSNQSHWWCNTTQNCEKCFKPVNGATSAKLI